MTPLYWLVGFVVIGLSLFVIGLVKRGNIRLPIGSNNANAQTKNQGRTHQKDTSAPDFDPLSILQAQLATLLPPDIKAHKNKRHLSLVQHGNTLALLTLDKKLPTGSRTLNGTQMINFQHNPSDKELHRTLASFISTLSQSIH